MQLVARCPRSVSRPCIRRRGHVSVCNMVPATWLDILATLGATYCEQHVSCLGNFLVYGDFGQRWRNLVYCVILQSSFYFWRLNFPPVEVEYDCTERWFRQIHGTCHQMALLPWLSIACRHHRAAWTGSSHCFATVWITLINLFGKIS